MTSLQIQAIQSTFAMIEPGAQGAMMLFYDRLFELDPALRHLFRTSREEQAKKLAQTLAVVVKSLDRLEQLLPAVRDLGARHARYGVNDRHYDTVGAALLWTLEEGLGPAFTADVRESWALAFETLARVMKDAASMECAGNASQAS
jgi:hemoglobin-like flavoprotein